MCDEAATATEHAPPKCFFPEKKDVGRDLRINLVTVPSCDAHNTHRSKHDEYAMMFVVTHYETNDLARDQFSSKCIRALKQSAGLPSAIFNRPKRVKVGSAPSVAVEVDRVRFDKVMDHTCRALYFHETDRKFEKELLVWSPAFRFPDLQPDLEGSKLAYSVRQVLRDQPRHGQNQDVFWYQIFDDPGRLTAFRLMFYEGCTVYAVSTPQASSGAA